MELPNKINCSHIVALEAIRSPLLKANSKHSALDIFRFLAVVTLPPDRLAEAIAVPSKLDAAAVLLGAAFEFSHLPEVGRRVQTLLNNSHGR